eukprot:TRINITY_DN552_c0_g1::TRINITY_DN552_c0_g1_i1::g.10459::m.10459 TRINITY_DN552_c0_g1::TRINITY_DN552_c0_g1_i1::g.10459  ORF type:complete len:720 (+),score=280.06,sp/Q91ZA3/PCCA_MOUSE/53.09/0.0,CPSase_L_D2/PF02786.12/1.5e-76,CPSase_L_chain/PF00289.17/1.6e-41,Biotin_carb_C/PF02785.14/6.9e-38,Biotin_carb_C/PF02785.14/6,Biotin_lipoyl/PF00364.17/1e-14,ATP-grasp_4/PF13535.1/3.5e-10,ATP-grasp_4/PF13535.1/3.1e+02,ATPgrasp_Ter/PF15632.1/6.6e-06,Dala_Dala_lig_C/PF07478.8/5.7e+03,Dala_Dala_lig_C/PF07478.8/4.9
MSQLLHSLARAVPTTASRGVRHYASKPLFDKILIANRGEIACRVVKTARRMGIKTVAIYSEADANSFHVKYADEAVCVGPAASAQSYLNMDRVIEAIKKTGAQAVHPGYGFLSENATFVKHLEDNNIVFIGPPSFAIHALGDKIESKKLAMSANVSTVPGYVGEVNTEEEVLRISHQIGYPVMIKASAGGGGKGMRVAWNDDDARIGFRLSKQEAKSSFGDDRMFIEKFIVDPRHVEIQLMADAHGNVVYLPERECSVQRRNQKVLEEAPSVVLDRETWHKMGSQAAGLAKAVGYRSAGTCEFLVDKHKNFFFLEMNTRLQVEHPVTEAITGLDLVEHMIRVAAGEKLGIQQDKIVINGWALESRVYAEDPFRGFLPSVGRLSRYQEPSGEGVRVDSGIKEGSEISIHYDPMIAKLITHGKDRAEAIAKQSLALDSYVIRGLRHNIPFLRAVFDSKRFQEGRLTTGFIPEEYPEGFKGKTFTPLEELSASVSGAAMYAARTLRMMQASSGKVSHFKIPEKFDVKVRVRKDNAVAKEKDAHIATYDMTIVPKSDMTFDMTVDGQEMHVEIISLLETQLFEFMVTQKGEAPHRVAIQSINRAPNTFTIQLAGAQMDVEVRSTAQAELEKYMPVKVAADTSKLLISPMPGLVRSVAVTVGQKVFPGSELVILEAMKMQNMLKSEREGVIKAIHFKAGDTVGADEVILSME